MQAAQSPTALYLPEGYRGDGGGGHNSDSNTGAPVSIVRSMSRDNGVQQSTRQSLAWLHTVPNVKKLARRNRQKEKRSKQTESQVDERGFSVDKWRGLLLSVAKTSAMYAERYTTAAESEKLASREKKGRRARNAANQMAIQNGCRAKALVRLASLAHQLHVRNPPCDWCMLMAVEEVARCEIVSLIYAAARVDVQPLTEALDLLRLLFPEDIDSVQQCKDSWLDMVDPVLLAALTECPIDDDDEKQKIDTVSGLFRVVPLKAIENKIDDGGVRNVKLENRALFQTLGQNEHVTEDRRIGQRNSSVDADRNCMVLAKDVPIVRPVPVRSNNTLQIVETLVQDTSTPRQSIEILKDKAGVTSNGPLRNIGTRNPSTESEIDEIQPQISVATQSDKSCASKPNIAENELGELEDIIVPVTEIVAEPSRPNIPVASNKKITTHAIATESTSEKSSSASTMASPANAGDNDEHYVGTTEEKHGNAREKHGDASTTITATVGTTNSLSEQVPPISDDVSSTSRQHQQQRKQLTTKSKDQTTTGLPTSSESSINRNNKEIPRIPPLFGAAIARRTNSDREARRSLHASTRFSIDFLRRSLDNASTVGSSVTTAEESDDQQAKQGERGGGSGSTATTATSKLKANFKNRVRRSRVSSDLKRERERGRNSAPTGKRRGGSQKFSRRSLDESAKGADAARKASWVKKLLRKRRAGAEGFARSTSMGYITTFTKRYTSKRFVDDAEIVVSDVDMSKSLTRATLLACYPGVSGVRNRQENEWVLRFGNRDNALNYLKDEKAITNTFGQSAKVELLGSCVQAA